MQFLHWAASALDLDGNRALHSHLRPHLQTERIAQVAGGYESFDLPLAKL
jgi:hypothetical protein